MQLLMSPFVDVSMLAACSPSPPVGSWGGSAHISASSPIFSMRQSSTKPTSPTFWVLPGANLTALLWVDPRGSDSGMMAGKRAKAEN